MAAMLSEADLQAVSDAVAEAERATAGEIFCVLARQSADYREVPLAWAAGVALIGPLVAVLLGWTPHWPADWVAQSERIRASEALTAYAAVQAALFALTALVACVPAVTRRLIPPSLARARVRRAALEQMLAKGVHRTEARTGVLIYASLAERRVEVVADETIHRQVDADVWADAADALTAGLRRGRPAEGFVAAVRLCGAVLAERFPPRAADRNELSDRVVEI